MKDLTCFAEGLVVTDGADKNLNQNVIVAGTTGAGKSVSIIYPKLLHTYHASLIVPLTKRDVANRFSELMKQRGYKVELLDFIDAKNSTVSYDPMGSMETMEDIMNFAVSLVETPVGKNLEPYWYEAAANVVAAEILLIKKNAEYEGKKPKFTDVIKLHRVLKLYGGELAYTTLDPFIRQAQELYPDTNIRQMFSVLSGIAPKTASCILSIVNNAYSSVFTEDVVNAMSRKRNLDMESIGRKKTVVFILSSAMNHAAHRFINLMYSQMFRSLFEFAERQPEGRLPVPVHMLCDDFSCGCIIKNMDSYMSVIRSSGIDVFLLIQSESQLRTLYGEYAAMTILDNCDTYVYMGGNDVSTARTVAEKINRPVNYVLSLPAEMVIVMRRGQKPVVAHRYRTFEDEVYMEHFKKEVPVQRESFPDCTDAFDMDAQLRGKEQREYDMDTGND
jgi:type IV secretory pathway TraG/TraD family ATPase VirD4